MENLKKHRGKPNSRDISTSVAKGPFIMWNITLSILNWIMSYGVEGYRNFVWNVRRLW